MEKLRGKSEYITEGQKKKKEANDENTNFHGERFIALKEFQFKMSVWNFQKVDFFVFVLNGGLRVFEIRYERSWPLKRFILGGKIVNPDTE